MLLCSLKCALTQATASTIYQVPSTICLRQAGANITTNERKKKKREIKLLTLTTKLFKIMEMEKFYVAPEVEVLEVAVEKGFEGSAQIPDMGEGDSGDAI